MIRIETVIINGKEYTRTWSDLGVMIARNGALYEEAVDPVDSGREYTETDVPVEDVEAEEADYLAALGRLGVSV